MNDTQDFKFKDFWGLLSKPFRWIFSMIGMLTGGSLIGIITSAVGMWGKIQSDDLGYVDWFRVLAVFVISNLVCLSALIVILAYGFTRIKFLETKDLTAIKNSEEKFCSYIEKLNQSVSLAGCILDEKEIRGLESGVVEGWIIVVSSKFTLDAEYLVDVIISNLKKGIKYLYLIPASNAICGMDSFNAIASSYWEAFLKAYNNEKSKSNCCRDYANINTVQCLKDYFGEHLCFKQIAKEYGLLTIVMYQRSLAAKTWDTIVMLPISGDNYYAFKVPESEGVRRPIIENDILELSSGCQKYAVK